MTQSAFQAAWVNQVLFVIGNRQDDAAFNVAADWHAAPSAPLGGAISREGLAGIVIPKLGPGDF